MSVYQSATKVTTTGTVVPDHATVTALWVTANVTGGELTLRDGGAGGSVKIDVELPPLVRMYALTLPVAGVRFATDVHATFGAGIDSLTLFFEHPDWDGM